MMPYEKLVAWKACHELALEVYQATTAWPRSELYGLISQARRAAYSAPANIAEGSAKYGHREFRRYLGISIGSLAELSYTLRFVRDRKMVSPAEFERLEAMRVRAGKLTWLLYRSLKERADRLPRVGKSNGEARSAEA